MSKVKQRTIMTKLIDDLELKVLKSPVNSTFTSVNGEDLLIVIAYVRQLEAVIMSMDEDPKKAKQMFK